MKTDITKIIACCWIFLLALTGCNPVYKKNTIFMPPKSESGLSCVKSCNSDQQMCNSQCLDRYEQCKVGLSSEIHALFDRQSEIYLSELDHYDRSMRQYNRSYDKYLSEKTSYQNQKNYANAACDDRHEIPCKEAQVIEQTLDDLRKNYYLNNGPLSVEPQKPTKPLFSDIANELIEKQCSKSCDCDAAFSQCFTQCGGQIKEEHVCVQNCKK